MPPQTPRSQALLRIVSLLLVTFLFIAMTEQDARHETRQRWLAEARRRQETQLLAHAIPSRATVAVARRIHRDYGATFGAPTAGHESSASRSQLRESNRVTR